MEDSMKKIIGLFLAGGLVLCAGCGNKKELTSIQLNPEANKVLVDTNTDIAIVTDPENVQLTDSDFSTLGGNVEVNKDNAEFSASKPGTYTITAKKDGITSNTIKITVVEQQTELAKVKVPDTKPKTDTSANSEANVSQSETDINVNVSDNTSSSSQTESSSSTTTTPSSSTTSSSSSNAGTSQSQSTSDSQDDDQPYIPPKADADALSASDLTKDPDKYAGQDVTVVGTLNDKGTSLDGMKLIGYPVGIHSVPAQLTGTLEKQDDGSYALDVTSYAQVQ